MQLVKTISSRWTSGRTSGRTSSEAALLLRNLQDKWRFEDKLSFLNCTTHCSVLYDTVRHVPARPTSAQNQNNLVF